MIDLENLSHVDFEDLCRDLAEVLTGGRFEAFGSGPDGGVDGRHSKSGHATILQCKHYLKSTFPNLRRSIQGEVEKIKKLKPSRYIIFTSHSLTLNKKQKILETLYGLPVEPADILGKEDIEAILHKNPEIHKAHIKLWLSSTAVLDRVLNSGLESFTNATREEILDDLRVYVRNESFDEAIKQLESNRVIIVSGPPGVGKTTLARMLTYQYLNEGWQFYAINSLKEGFAKIDDGNPTVFFFDDFLGRIELNKKTLHQHDSSLALFVKRIQKSKNARFILTTRAHIFEEARLISDCIDDRNVQLTKYLLDVEKYTRRVKAHILFNHLIFSDLTEKHFLALLNADIIRDIVDHNNYNPRIVSQISSSRVDPIKPEEFPDYVLSALNQPERIWQKPFKALEFKSQNLLYSLFFCDQVGVSIKALQINYNALHKLLCNLYGHPLSPYDFEDALRNLESGFISIAGQKVEFVNPSVHDFLNSRLVDFEFLKDLTEAAERADWARGLWRHGKKALEDDETNLRTFAKAFLSFTKIIDKYPTMRITNTNEVQILQRDDLSLLDRVAFLYDLAFECGDSRFLESALSILNSDQLRIIPEDDAKSGIRLYKKICVSLDENSVIRQKLLDSVGRLVATAIESNLNLEELVGVIEVVRKSFDDEPPKNVQDAIDNAVMDVEHQVLDTEWRMGTEQSLVEQFSLLDKLEGLTGVDASELKEIVSEQLGYYEIIDYDEYEFSGYPEASRTPNGPFDDFELNSFFKTLIQK